ncbi:CHAT domain-containing protein [Portibacter marinus]|uniref:CHAT domain-containing protein n=1 Tax=Portibacter marinus TaxID=2898660 RepID=UPI001F422839|nr:CHAT domain-containing protein [Portibacter marinus]
MAEALSKDYRYFDENINLRIYYFLGVVHKGLHPGQVGKGYEYFQKAEEELNHLVHPDTSIIAQLYGMLSDIAWQVRDLDRGMKYVQKYKHLNEAFEKRNSIDPEQVMQTRYHLLYKEVQFLREDQYEDAIEIVKEAELYYEEFSENDEIKLRMASIYNLTGEKFIRTLPARSIPYYQKAISVLNNPSSSYHLQYLFNLGKASVYSGQEEEALLYINELIEKGSEVDDNRLPFFLFLKSLAYIRLNDFDSALSITKEVIKDLDPKNEIDLVLHKGLSDFQPSSAPIVNINLLSRMAMEFYNGFKNNESALSIANALYQLGIHEYSRSIKAAKVTPYTKTMYEQLVGGILSTKAQLKEGDLKIEDLIAFSENTNHKYLWTNHKLNHSQETFFDKKLVARESSLREELLELKQKILSDSSQLVHSDIFEIEMEIEKIERQKRNSNSSYYLFEEAEFSMDDLTSRLKHQDQIFKYENILDSTYLFIISKDYRKVISLAAKDSLELQVAGFLQLLNDPHSDLPDLKSQSTDLCNLLFPEWPVTKKLLIKADGILQFLPFEVLMKNGDYLLAHYDISYLSALAFYETMSNSKEVANALFVAPSYSKSVSNEQEALRQKAYDLSGAKNEVDRIGKLIKGRVLKGKEASKSSFMEVADNFDLLHFSMHSNLNDYDPELINLVFHGADEDNRLYLNELYGMRLQAKMAVLSACNTGVGKVELGEGLVSLDRAFAFAGVPSVVATLWPAPDQSTSDIMFHFYQKLKEGNSKSAALSASKFHHLQMQAGTAFEHPFYWAGVVLYGDTSSLIFGEKQNLSLTSVFIFGSLLLLGLLFLFRNKILS